MLTPPSPPSISQIELSLNDPGAEEELAALDAKRSINMIKKLNLKVYGVVENMTGGIFGTGGAKDMADELGLPTLTEISLLPEYSDNNEPAIFTNSQCEEEFSKLVDNLEGITSKVN